MYKNILLAIDLNDEASCRKPLLSAVEVARTFCARLHVLTRRARGRSHPASQNGAAWL